MGSAVVYLRISQDRTGSEAGVERQREDCLALAARLELGVPEVFVDNDVSAYDGSDRPGYEAMLDWVRHGASPIVVWHLDRLYRQPRELEVLLDLVEHRSVRIETVRGGAFDLNTNEGQLMARQFVAIAAYESGHKADRVVRALRQRAEQGLWHGPARYGYARGGVLIPEQARVIREMADRFLAGESIRSITAWLNSNATPRRAVVGHAKTVRSILASARISGQRAHAPGVVSDPPDGREILGPGRWEAIITPEETARIRQLLGDSSRRRAAPAVQSLLGGIAQCGRCGAGLIVTTHKNTDGARTVRYACRKDPGHPERGGLSINADHLDTYVTDKVLGRLARPGDSDVAETDSEPSPAWARIYMIVARLREIRADYDSRLLSFREYEIARTAGEEVLHEAEAELVGPRGATELHGAPYGDRGALTLWWDGLDVGQQRKVINTVINRIVIAPGSGGRSFDSARVRLTFSR